MAYTVDNLRAAVRALLQNQGPSAFPDDQLDQAILAGKRRLDRDYPYEKSKRLSAIAGGYYNLTTLVTDWAPNFSVIKRVINPAPDVTTKEEVQHVPLNEIKVLEIEGSWYMRYDEQVASGRTLLIYYTVPWTVEGLADATATTLVTDKQNALEFICTSFAALSLATKMSGSTSRQIPGDIIDWGTKEAQYRRNAREWETLYMRELGMREDKPKPVSVIKDFDPVLSDGQSYLTHRRSLR